MFIKQEQSSHKTATARLKLLFAVRDGKKVQAAPYVCLILAKKRIRESLTFSRI